jgi:hypothetical protein
MEKGFHTEVDMKLAKKMALGLGLVGSSLMAAAVVLGSSSPAQAQFANPSVTNEVLGWCHITGKLDFHSVGFIIGGTEGKGHGHIKCEYYDGSQENIAVAISTNTVGIMMGEAKGTMSLFASGIGVAARGARTLLGKYGTVKGSVQVIRLGADAGLSITLDRDGFSIPLTLQGRKGMGLEAGLEVGDFVFTEIAPDSEPRLRKVRAQQAPQQQLPQQQAMPQAGEQELPPPPPVSHFQFKPAEPGFHAESPTE